ncbi:MAG TPA: hypothetical protein VGA36_07190 [Nitriliruptorales bacterium]
MHLHVDDDGFVRAPVGLVYRRLTDIGAWSSWWPAVRTSAIPGGEEAWQVAFGRRGPRCQAIPGTWRHDQGFRLALTGDLEGTLEFWLEEGHGGTVVHVILQADSAARRPLRVLARFRRSARRGLWALKDMLQAEVRQAIGQDA